jgi:DNA-directed RNA polymerase II subunit RPB2
LEEPEAWFDDSTKSRVIVNGVWIGVTSEADGLLDRLRGMRRRGVLSWDTSIIGNQRENNVRILTDAGRCLRPLLIVKDNKLVLQESHLEAMKKQRCGWSYLIRAGVIEYVDALEEENSLIAMRHEDLEKPHLVGGWYSHCEIHPSMMLGCVASVIPFSDHNQAPRNCYQSSQSKQAIGVYAMNFAMRMDTVGHVLFYPQKPLVSTKHQQVLGYDDIPSGQNCIVAIAAYTGLIQPFTVKLRETPTSSL